MSAVCNTSQSSRVKVWVRTRPTLNFAHHMINFDPDGKSIRIHSPRDPKKGLVNNQLQDWSFKLDGIMHNASQEDVYATTTADVVTAALDGYNGTVMCYGQTGAGKTFSVTGSTESYQNRGIIPRAISHLFKEINNRTEYSINVRISYMEIYNETMVDLLATLPSSMSGAQTNHLQLVEDDQGVAVRGLQCLCAQNEEDALNFLFESRSRVESNARYTLSKVNLVDLAGSERLGKTQSEGKTKEEAMYINKSLLFLEQVVMALADKRRDFVPFRQCKLTHYLKDSIAGNCNTRLIANIWAEAAQIEETISTLRFATGMMCVANVPAVNVHYDPVAMVKSLEKELSLLKKELLMHDALANRGQVNYDPLCEQQRKEIQQQVQAYLQGSSDEIDIINLHQIQGVFEAFRNINKQLSKDIENKLRSKYTLIDKSDPAAIAAAQQAGIPVDNQGELVGDVETSGFSIGSSSSDKPAPSSVIDQRKAKATRKAATQPTAASSPAYSNSKTSVADSVQNSEKDDSKYDERMSANSAPVRPSSPPSRNEAFDEFKREAGSTINQILLENKDMLSIKKQQYANVAQEINRTKTEMDESLKRLSCLKEEREAEGNTTTEDGEIIISEAEYLEITRVKDLKKEYKIGFEELKAIKVEVQYCQRLVEQCRHKLIQEFDNWYAESFLGGPTERVQTGAGDSRANLDASQSLPTALNTVFGADTYVEDEQERFNRLQKAVIMNQPESSAFYSAQMRTNHRKFFEAAASQASLGTHKKPGTPTRTVRNQPSTVLQVQH